MNREASGRAERHIRSYVSRNRLTTAQRRALTEHWPRFGIDLDGNRLDITQIFDQPAPVVLEIGCGNGDLLTRMATRTPERNFLGIEVYRSGVGSLLRKTLALSLKNLRVICADAVKTIDHIPDNSLSQVMIMFPDPWPKKRHHKRRLVTTGFIGSLTPKMKPGSLLCLATDSKPYAEEMRLAVECTKRYRSRATGQIKLPQTAFEKRARRAGRPIFNLFYNLEL